MDKRLELVPPFWVFRLSFSTLFRLANIVSSGWPAARGGAAPLTHKTTHAIDVGVSDTGIDLGYSVVATFMNWYNHVACRDVLRVCTKNPVHAVDFLPRT